MGIQITRLELETSPDSGRENRPVAGSYFEPLTDAFMSVHPIDSQRLEKLLKRDPEFLVLRDYDSSAAIAEDRIKEFGQRYWGPKECLEEVVAVFEQHISRVPRLSREGFVGDCLTDLVDWSEVNHTVTLSQAYYLPSRKYLRDDMHPVKIMFEAVDYVYPHVTMVVQHNTKDIVNDDLILRHELAYILHVMRTRLHEGLFAKKQPQPVLMVSFVAPQNGRILEAYIEDQCRVKVACSRLYSFEHNSTAPFPLFYRWFLGRPIGIEPSKPRPRPHQIGSDMLCSGPTVGYR
ncbi:hypothetical protein DTO280E4_2232 [Paecilomyces variotii]|nr:hypothetical protein DTO280E4_2232 [Paecilomyces variotii]